MHTVTVFAVYVPAFYSRQMSRSPPSVRLDLDIYLHSPLLIYIPFVRGLFNW